MPGVFRRVWSPLNRRRFFVLGKGVQVQAVGLATETDTAQNIVIDQAYEIGLAASTEQAFSIASNFAKVIALGAVEEIDSALEIAIIGGDLWQDEAAVEGMWTTEGVVTAAWSKESLATGYWVKEEAVS